MSKFRGLILAGAALVLCGSSVQAADLHARGGSMKDTYVPAAPRGCATWYARIDAGHTSYDRPAGSEIGIDDYMRPTLDDTWSLGGGVGRYFTCAIRADVTVDHRFDSGFRGKNDNPNAPVYGTHRFDMSSTAIMANFYYDFDLRSRFTPYIGVGFGVVQNTVGAGKGVADDGTQSNPGDPIAIKGGDRWHAAGALMTGFTMAMRDSLKLDAGYRFLYMGEAKTGQITNLVTNGVGGASRIEDLHAHEFRLGLRYDIR